MRGHGRKNQLRPRKKKTIEATEGKRQLRPQKEKPIEATEEKTN
jgi:hypothetical protein